MGAGWGERQKKEKHRHLKLSTVWHSWRVSAFFGWSPNEKCFCKHFLYRLYCSQTFYSASFAKCDQSSISSDWSQINEISGARSLDISVTQDSLPLRPLCRSWPNLWIRLLRFPIPFWSVYFYTEYRKAKTDRVCAKSCPQFVVSLRLLAALSCSS